MNYRETVEYLNAMESHGIRLGLQNIQTALSLFGNPQDSFKSILVAGTNGKGSTCAFLNQILIENKYKTGFYSSPHLVKYNERICVNNKPVSDAEFALLATHLREKLAYERLELTHFEFLTLMAQVYFQQKKVEFAVLEVGMGGRLDATNAVNSVANVITTIGLDHEEYLGESLRQIAMEKGGIIKNDAPLVCGVTHPELQGLFADLASAANATPQFIAKDFFFFKKTVSFPFQSMDFKGFGLDLKDIPVNLWGFHQLQNASLALATAAVLKEKRLLRLSEKSIFGALKKTVWPGRFQVLQKNPLVILDGGHNPSGMKAFRQALEDAFPNQKLAFVIGIKNGKAFREMLETILPLASRAILCQARYHGLPTTELAAIAKNFLPSFKIQEIADVKSAVKSAIAASKPDEIVVICGSLFVAGECLELKWNGEKKKRAKQKNPLPQKLTDGIAKKNPESKQNEP